MREVDGRQPVDEVAQPGVDRCPELVAPSGSADHAPQAVVPYQERYDAATAAIAELLLEISRLREASITPLGSAYGGLRPLVRRILDRMR